MGTNGQSSGPDAAAYVPLWRDAYGIAIVGACNPRGVSRTLTTYIDAGYDLRHPAMRAIWGHLAFLLKQGLGPEIADLDIVSDTYREVQS